MTDRRVKMALSDAFGRLQYNQILPTPFAFARWGLPCHFSAVAASSGPTIRTRNTAVTENSALIGCGFGPGSPSANALRVASIRRNLPGMAGSAGRKPAKTASSDAVSTGNTNLAHSRPNLPKSNRQNLLTASWLAYILTMDVTRHYAEMVHDKRLQM
jgi:hypothetical protein